MVADEVRGLAQRTQQSTNEIQRMISTLQGGARDAVQAMSHSSEHVEASVEQAQRAAAALDGISQRVTQITAMSQQVERTKAHCWRAVTGREDEGALLGSWCCWHCMLAEVKRSKIKQ